MIQNSAPLLIGPFSTMIGYVFAFTLSHRSIGWTLSFSKLKLIKSYLRSTMSQERLSGLVILSIEKEMF